MSPQLVADVTLYPAAQGGRQTAALPGWGCPCCTSKAHPIAGYDAWPLLGDSPLEPSARRRLGFVFSSKEAPEIFEKSKKFYLWEGRFIGEAVVVEPDGI